MSSKQTFTLFAVALVGGILGAAVMQYVGPVDIAALGIRKASRHEERPEEHAHNHDDEHNPTKERDGHNEEQVVRLSEAERKEFDIEVGTAGSGKLQMHITLPGEVVLNADRRAQVVPRVPGVVRQVHKTLGEPVRAGEVMVVLDSRELADLKSAYLAGKERVTLAEATFQREESLWKKNISPEQEYLEAKKALAEARIELRAAKHKLHALGFADPYLAQLPAHPDTTFMQYTVTAPFDGTVIEKNVALGEVLKDDASAFVVADLRSVWVDLRVYQKDLPSIRKGQPVVIAAGQGIPDARGTIAYIGPVVGEQTRTALARVVLPNPDGHWRPGVFVTGMVVVNDIDISVLVPKTALQTIDERPVVFVETDTGFQPQPVTLGRSNEARVEVTAGLTPGQRYVTSGAFTLKAQLAKSTFGDGHGH